uniref:Small ribosomal subunit protein mS41 n=1 Tax=Percolomonas cosmopolitus TaxID=63605 RepID=A0A7S1PHV0_9EUKA
MNATKSLHRRLSLIPWQGIFPCTLSSHFSTFNINNTSTHLSKTTHHQSHSFFATRSYSTEADEEEELDDEEREKRAKIAKLSKPYIYQAVIPRPRRGLNHKTFLKLIRDKKHDYDFEQYADEKINTWDELFLLKSEQLKILEIPTKERKHILRWVNWYRQGRTPGFRKPKEFKAKRYARQSRVPMMYQHEKMLRREYAPKQRIERVIAKLEEQKHQNSVEQ